jgi:hypothetical protein
LFFTFVAASAGAATAPVAAAPLLAAVALVPWVSFFHRNVYASAD